MEELGVEIISKQLCHEAMGFFSWGHDLSISHLHQGLRMDTGQEIVIFIKVSTFQPLLIIHP